MQVESWSVTDVGLRREHNEDSVLVDDALHLYVVADGMGGHRAGATASQTAVEVIRREVENGVDSLSNGNGKAGSTQMLYVSDEPVIELLTTAVQQASAAILDKVDSDIELDGMGTTAVCLFFHDNRGFFAHVGDSRLYRLRGDELKQITTDHSLVQEQVDAGLISREEANNSQYKNIITRSVGFERNIKVDCREIDCAPGDLFLLCSDGLSNPVSDRELKDIMSQKDPATALKFFVNLANSRGGDDNLSAIVVRITADA